MNDELLDVDVLMKALMSEWRQVRKLGPDDPPFWRVYAERVSVAYLREAARASGRLWIDIHMPSDTPPA